MKELGLVQLWSARSRFPALWPQQPCGRNGLFKCTSLAIPKRQCGLGAPLPSFFPG